MSVAIALFTRDLRVHDNPVLTAAHHAADAVIPLFVIDPALVEGPTASPNRNRFLATALAELDDELRAAGSRLVIRRGNIATTVAAVVTETGADQVHIAADVSGYSRRREHALREHLSASDCALHTHADVVSAVPPGELTPSGGGTHFAVFTPYHRRWLEVSLRQPLSRPRSLTVPRISSENLPDPAEQTDGGSPELAVGGATTGRKLLGHWLSGPIDDYAESNDDLSADATSRLSPYLHFGCLSPIEILHRVDGATPGGESFARQLAWRDFNHQLLAARPEIAHEDYRSRRAPWRDDPDAAEAWRDARTGYPVIDAGLRQLRAEGWMPGRARLIAASFLTKSLGIDWRFGADHFRYWLVDGDVANNQLNWQWAAGTGTDTRPNRVLNPIRQAQRYDPEGAYVRRWIPELADLPGADIHRPWRADIPAGVYPPPLVECNGM